MIECIGDAQAVAVHHVTPDLEPFRSPDGAFISGRNAWREHLKETDSIELSHSDITQSQSAWNSRKEAHQDKLRRAVGVVKAYTPSGEAKPVQASRLAVDIANRLHGRPAPGRKELIKLTLDVAKRMNRGR